MPAVTTVIERTITVVTPQAVALAGLADWASVRLAAHAQHVRAGVTPVEPEPELDIEPRLRLSLGRALSIGRLLRGRSRSPREIDLGPDE